MTKVFASRERADIQIRLKLQYLFQMLAHTTMHATPNIIMSIYGWYTDVSKIDENRFKQKL